MSASAPEVMSERALQRRLKRHLLKAQQRFMVVCGLGLEPILHAELRALEHSGVSLTDIQSVSGGAELSAPLDSVYALNAHLRVANRVLLRLEPSFLAQSYPMLFDHSRKLPWELFLGFAPTFNIRVSATTSRLRHSRNLTHTLHSAILRRLNPLGLTPKLSADADIEVYARLFQDRCTLSINTSGTHLHKRGYRIAVGEAPIRETLAAAAAYVAGVTPRHSPYGAVVDPFCGSGTFLIELAAVLHSLPAGQQRRFAFEAMPWFHEGKWARQQNLSLPTKFETSVSHVHMMGFDKDATIIRGARDNARRAGAEQIMWHARDIHHLSPTELKALSAHGLIISNPPYGMRLSDAKQAQSLYAELLKRVPYGWDVALLTPDVTWVKASGVRIKKTMSLYNGALKVWLVWGSVP